MAKPFDVDPDDFLGETELLPVQQVDKCEVDMRQLIRKGGCEC